MTETEEIYKRGYTHALKDTQKQYEQGLNDAWECARKIAVEMSIENMQSCGLISNSDEEYEYSCGVIRDYSASEAMAKIKEYESKKLYVGDELANDDRNCVITKIVDEHYVNIMYVEKDGSSIGAMGYIDPTKYKKTGRHFPQIEEVLNAMKEGINDI